MPAVYCNCFSTPGPSFTICPSQEVRAGLQLGKQFCSSFIPLIPHLHIHQELPETPLPQPPPKLCWEEALTPLLPREGVGNTRLHQPAVTGLGGTGVTRGQDEPSVVQPLLLPAAKPAASTTAQTSWACPSPASVQGLEQRGIGEGVPARGGGWNQMCFMVLPIQTVP